MNMGIFKIADSNICMYDVLLKKHSIELIRKEIVDISHITNLKASERARNLLKISLLHWK